MTATMPRRKKKDYDSVKDLPAWAQVLYALMTVGMVLFAIVVIVWALGRIWLLVMGWAFYAFIWPIFQAAKD